MRTRGGARDVGGFCEKLRRTEDREFLIRLAPRGAARLLPDVLWEKGWTLDSLSNEWKGAGRDLVAYFAAAAGTHHALSQTRRAIIASKILVADLRRGDLSDVLRGPEEPSGSIGLLHGGLARIWRDHREVRNYRRTMSNRDALAQLAGAPAEWA